MKGSDDENKREKLRGAQRAIWFACKTVFTRLAEHTRQHLRAILSNSSYFARRDIASRFADFYADTPRGEGGKKGKSKSHLSQYINSIFSSRLSTSIDSREIELIGRIDDSRSCERDENVALWSSRESCVFRNSYLTRDISLTLIIHMRYLILLNLFLHINILDRMELFLPQRVNISKFRRQV